MNFSLNSFNQVCNVAGNVVIFSNYDGGVLNINVDQNIANLKIGICTYEAVEVNFSGPFVGNITEVIYAGFDGTNNNCGTNPPSTIINGVSPALVTQYSSSNIAIANYLGELIMPGFPPLVNCMVGAEGSCDGSNAGGGNSASQIVQFFLAEFGPGSVLHSHYLDYACFPPTLNISNAGNCCYVTPTTPPNPIYTGGSSYDFIPDDTMLCSASITLDLSFYEVLFQPPTYPGYVWSDGTTGPTITITTPGTYSFTVGDYCHSGIDLLTDTIVVTSCCSAPPAPILGATSNYCLGDIMPPVTATAVNGGTLTWYSDAALSTILTTGSSFIIPNSVGTFTYYVTETDAGCEGPPSSFSISIFPLPTVSFSATPSLTVCQGASVTLSGNGASTYSWTGGIFNNVAFSPASSNSYTVVGTDVNGCENSSTALMSVIICEPLVAGFSFDNSICAGDCVQFTDTTSGIPTQWEWTFQGGSPATSNLQNPIICFDLAGVYTIDLTVLDAALNSSTTTSSISTLANSSVTASQDTVIDLGGTVILNATGSGIGGYIWSPDGANLDCDTCQSTSASPFETTSLLITFVDTNGCVSYDTLIVYVNFIEGIGVPQAFSPNGDGTNDVLFVKGLGIERLSFSIYNRYGQRVFDTQEQNIGWDGNFKNQPENPGVFVWTLEYAFMNGTSGLLSGNVTLVR